MRLFSMLAITAACAAPLSAQNLVPDGHFDVGATNWSMTQFNDPIGTTGFGPARTTGNGPSNAVFGSFNTLTAVYTATYRGQPFALSGGAENVSFNCMWDKQATTPIPYASVNRVELRIYDFVANTLQATFTLGVPNQTALQERASFSGTFTPPAPGVYVAEVFIRHSNLANMPYIAWVDDVVVGSPSSLVFGRGCAGTGSFVPVISSTNAPAIGSTNFSIDLNDAAPLTAAVFGMGFSNSSFGGLPLPFALGGGCDLLVAMQFRTISVLSGAAPGSGAASQLLPIPNAPALQNQRLYTQWGVVDAAAANPFGLAMTAGLMFYIQ